MTALVRIDLTSLSLDELADLREQLRCRPGQRSPETKRAIEQRDALIRELAALAYPGVTRNQQAEAIRCDLLRYETTTWLLTRGDADCRDRDARRRLLWQILKTRPHVPAVRTINDILAGRGSSGSPRRKSS